MKLIQTDNAPGAIGPYSQAFATNGLVYTSGQIPVDPANGEAAGSGFDRVIKTTCFLADMGDFAAFNEVYARYFVSKPARSCVAVKTLPKNVLCEIEAIAEV